MTVQSPTHPWNPWHDLSLNYPQVYVSVSHELPGNIWGLTSGHRIWICRRLSEVQRKCTLAHELVHYERGAVLPRGTAAYDAEERIVEAVAADRLIPAESLKAALAEHFPGAGKEDRLGEVAAALQVDLPTLRVRLRAEGREPDRPPLRLM